MKNEVGYEYVYEMKVVHSNSQKQSFIQQIQRRIEIRQTKSKCQTWMRNHLKA